MLVFLSVPLSLEVPITLNYHFPSLLHLWTFFEHDQAIFRLVFPIYLSQVIPLNYLVYFQFLFNHTHGFSIVEKITKDVQSYQGLNDPGTHLQAPPNQVGSEISNGPSWDYTFVVQFLDYKGSHCGHQLSQIGVHIRNLYLHYRGPIVCI